MQKEKSKPSVLTYRSYNHNPTVVETFGLNQSRDLIDQCFRLQSHQMVSKHAVTSIGVVKDKCLGWYSINASGGVWSRGGGHADGCEGHDEQMDQRVFLKRWWRWKEGWRIEASVWQTADTPTSVKANCTVTIQLTVQIWRLAASGLPGNLSTMRPFCDNNAFYSHIELMSKTNKPESVLDTEANHLVGWSLLLGSQTWRLSFRYLQGTDKLWDNSCAHKWISGTQKTYSTIFIVLSLWASVISLIFHDIWFGQTANSRGHQIHWPRSFI